MTKMAHPWATCMSLRSGVTLLRSFAALPLALVHSCIKHR